MRAYSRLVVVLALVIGCSDRRDEEAAIERAATPRVADDNGIDRYARPPGGAPSPVLAMNRDRKLTPPTNYNPGHGSPIEAPSARRTGNGWQIQFATHSPVPTPTVYDGKVVVSGGFNSREIYAYNATTGRSVWSRTLSDDGPSTAACEGKFCVFNSESCTTFMVSAETGDLLWSYWLGDPQTSAPAVANGKVFTSYPATMAFAAQYQNGVYDEYGTLQSQATQPVPTGATHVIAAFDMQGKLLWQRWLDSDVISSPVAVGNMVYATTFAGSVVKIDQETGELVYAVSMRATSAPVVIGNSLYVTRRVEEKMEAPREAIVRADLGETSLTFRAVPRPAPYLDGDVQRLSEQYQTAQVDDAENGFGTTPAAANAGVAMSMVGVASVSTMQRFQGSRVLHLGDSVVSTMGDEVVSVDAQTGAPRWRHALRGNAKAGGHLGTAPLLAGTDIVVATLGGEVIRLDARTGKLVASYKTDAQLRSQPVVEGGWIYLGTEDGRLIAIDTGDRDLTGWPTWGGDIGRTATRTL
jgi:outer membrane protein assembly factor BamB